MRFQGAQKIGTPYTMLLDLTTQQQFEAMWTASEPLAGMRADGLWVQYHTAKWCGACKHLNLPAIVAAAEKQGISVWKIDVDVNDYTSGYCGVRSIPTFQICKPGKIIATFQNNDTDTVIDWMMNHL